MNSKDKYNLNLSWQTSPFIHFSSKNSYLYLTRWEVFQIAEKLSQQLPQNNFSTILLFEKRHFFLIGLIATALKNINCILPPNLAKNTLLSINNSNPNLIVMSEKNISFFQDNVYINEQIIEQLIKEIKAKPTSFNKKKLNLTLNKIQESKIILYTSGSTGSPKKIIKTWNNMILSSKLATSRFKLNQPNYIVATVPCQHMFGLETTIFWPLFSSSSIWFERVIFPEDILSAFKANKIDPTFLISTPLHLKKILEFNLSWPKNITRILSATDFLSKELATKIEKDLVLMVFEVYGSTETASIASRQTTKSSLWKIYHKVELKFIKNKTTVKTPGLDDFILLNDQIKKIDATRFKLGKRNSDLIKIAGKRASLIELNKHLNSIFSILEGVFIKIEDKNRLIAFVVSDLTSFEIIAKLRPSIDPAFLPRPIYFIKKIPRNEVGKVMYNQLISKLKN